MEFSLVISDRLPPPARHLPVVVQSLLKVGKHAAEAAIHAGQVRVNGRLAQRLHLRLEPGDRVEIFYAPPPQRSAVVHSRPTQELEIVFDDPHLTVLNKPPELLTVPTPKRESRTVQSLLEKQWQAAAGLPEKAKKGPRAFCVHRLDRGVSGLLVFAKSLEVREKLRDQFADRKPRRCYVALVQGNVEQDAGTFRSHLATDDDLNRYSTTKPDEGELAITHYRVLERLADATLVEVTLETGRRNQIRVHFFEAGHPVLGDARYGRRAAPHPLWPFKRLALHAETLGFVHPVTQKRLEFKSPLPLEMQRFLQQAAEPRRKKK